MRKYFLILSILSFANVFSQQIKKSLSELEVQYEYSFVRDTTDIDPNHRFKELMLLDFNSHYSLFYSQQYLAARNAIKKATIEAQTA
ncbi:hypothetical protein SB659_19260, partial [Arthrobacter sp. SIMBA_036]|uniref:hypothetical protein n=1 Tax=Arthrobacter sp. SIMBA_036 TaxID=3085778 RepID=UPI00397C3525